MALMKSIDIRAEAAVKLLAEFLDMDTTYTETGRKVNAEHFAHVLSSFQLTVVIDRYHPAPGPQYDTPVLSRSSPPPEVRRRRHDRWIPEEEKQSRSRPYSQSRGGPSSDVGDESDTLERSPRDIHSPPRNSYREDRIHQPKYRRRRGQEVVKRDRYQERSRSPEPGPSSQRSRSRSRSRYRDQVDPLLYHGDRSPVRPDKSRRPYSPSSSSSLMHQRGRKSISPGGVAKKDDEGLLPIPETLVQRFDPTGAPATTPQLMNDALPAGISIKGASKANSMQPRLAIAGLSIKGRASKEKASVTVIEHAETSTGVALPSLPGRMSDAKVEAASQKPHSYHGTSVDQAAAASVAEMMARTRTQMQAKREEEPRAGANGQADEWLTEEESSRDTTRLRRERLISRLEEERRICAAGARADEAKADSSLSMGPAGDTLSKGAPQSFNQKSALDEQEAKLRVRARLRIKLAAETRQALDRDTRNDKVRIGDAESRSKVRAVNGQVQEPDTRASLEEGLKARLKEKLSDRSSRKPAPPMQPVLAHSADIQEHRTYVGDEEEEDNGGYSQEQQSQEQQQMQPFSVEKRRRERPPTLDLAPSMPPRQPDRSGGNSDRERERRQHSRAPQQHSEPPSSFPGGNPDNRRSQARTSSSTSSSALDAYYFSNPTPNPSPPPEMAQPMQLTIPKTPDFMSSSHHSSVTRHDPQTPARDPSAIDRRGLVGVGELATPRWVQSTSSRRAWEGKEQTVAEEGEPAGDNAEDTNVVWDDADDGAGNTWANEQHEEPQAPPPLPHQEPISQPLVAPRRKSDISRSLRHKPSMASESGNEEILYKPPPRKSIPPPLPIREDASYEYSSASYANRPSIPAPVNGQNNHYAYAQQSHVEDLSSASEIPASNVPPPQPHRARKRTSDEFAFDQTGTLMPKPPSSGNPSLDVLLADREREERLLNRRRSLGVSGGGGYPKERDRDRDRERAREKRKTDGNMAALGLGNPAMAVNPNPPMVNPSKSTSSVPSGPSRDRHARQNSIPASASANSALTETTSTAPLVPISSNTPRRAHTTHTDFPHMPPSPSSTGQFQNRMRTATAPVTPPIPTHHSSPSVGHALLRGNQEGFAGAEDQATVEALRMLDGVGSSNKVRNRNSTRSGGGGGSTGSRPPTPGQKVGGQWDGQDNSSQIQSATSASLQPSAAKKARSSMGGKDQLGGRTSASNLRVADMTLPEPNQQIAGATPGSEIGDPLSNGDADESSWVQQRQPAHSITSHGSASTNMVPPLPSAPGAHSHVPNRRSLNGKDGAPAPGSQRSSFGIVPKRGSASSTTFTGTPTSGSRDSTTLSSTTSSTSISMSNKHSYGKARRNSGGSDVSSVHSGDAAGQRDRRPPSAGGHDDGDEAMSRIPPVPPLPKDLANYKSPLPSATASSFSQSSPYTPPHQHNAEDTDRTIIIPSFDIPSSPSRPLQQPVTATPVKQASKKWSFSALSLHLPGSYGSHAKDSRSNGSASPGKLSPRSSRSSLAVQAQEYNNEQTHKDVTQSKYSGDPWSPQMLSPDISSSDSQAFSPAAGYSRTPEKIVQARTPERPAHSRSGTASSASTHTHTATKLPPSPKRSTAKRLTPSAIPFFRRSSSQSMKVSASTSNPKSSGESSSSPTRQTSSAITYHNSTSSISTAASTPDAMMSPSATKKSSMLSLLKGSGSRKSVHMEKPVEKPVEKERSESRISVLMGRKRGKVRSFRVPHCIPKADSPTAQTVSATEPKKQKEQMPLPPMQVSALPASTNQRIANSKSSSMNGGNSTLMTPTKSSQARSIPSPANNLNKASDASLRMSRQQLPTIAGSPSVGPVGAPPSTQASSMSMQYASSMATNGANMSMNGAMREKDTPTKIPRVAGRTSATSSPQSTWKGPSSTATHVRRASLNNSSMSNVSSNNTEVPPSPQPQTTSFVSDFGVIETSEPGAKSGTITHAATAAVRGSSTRSSPQSISRAPRQSGIPASSVTSSKRPVPRDSLYSGLRKASNTSITSLSAATQEVQPVSSSTAALVQNSSTSSHRLSTLSPSKSMKMLTPKMSLPAPRIISSAANTSAHQNGSPSSSRQSFSTPSPSPSSLDEDEVMGDEEMMAYIKRTQARKLANGAKKEDLDEMLRFPEPLPPVPPSSPAAILKSSQGSHLSDYERKEILDFKDVYCVGAFSDKKPATRDNPNNNYGYDDDRGDYLVVNHDHLNYRYEVIGTLGKGSFGQVLQARDHATGQSMAIKIIRNKKRFHHQALVEIKILDNLRKWDADEKHHVIKMSEHFYFRNHLCIAMELLSINLYELIKANGFVGFTTTLIRRFTAQMLGSLALMRHHRIVHCDLKPESRFYRSPEVILGMNYHMAIDMWSLGCILAELYTGFPIFPGENEQEQLSCIMEVLGVPDKELVNKSSRKKLFFDSTGAPRPVVNSKGRRRRAGSKTLAQVLRCDDELFIDFIAKCLTWDPDRRLKPQPATRHPFLANGRKPKPALAAAASATRNFLSSSSSSVSSRSNKPPQSQESQTPRKSLIGAPTPLTARVSSRAPTSSGLPSTPISATPSQHPSLISHCPDKQRFVSSFSSDVGWAINFVRRE
ncbi:hypothetical protein FRB96_008180 [Tulasnella sp. 330]|nr:hypothetical protein FRB96_008180 [Tulasnella sp. 330]